MTNNFNNANALLNSMCVLKCSKEITIECLKMSCNLKRIIENMEFHYAMEWGELVTKDLKRVMELFVNSLTF